MLCSPILSLSFLIHIASAIVQSPVKGPLKGFNYNPADDVATLFPLAKNELSKIGAPGFTSARVYTALDPDSSKPVPHPVFRAAGNTNTSVLIGLACSLGDQKFQNELTALTAVLADKDNKYGNLVAKNLIVGISVGNEDFYRQSVKDTPLAASLGDGSKTSTIIKQINLVRKTLAELNPPLDTKLPVGHTDTWRMWVDKDYGAKLLSAQPKQDDFKPIDFIGMQAFGYWEGYDIHNSSAYTTEALDSVKSVAGDIPIWATETGWPIDGPKCCDGPPNAPGMPGMLAYAGKDEAQIWWKKVGCETLFAGSGSEARNTWWYRLYASPGKSAAQEKGIEFQVLSKAAKGKGGVEAAFPLGCDVDAPTVAAPVESGEGIKRKNSKTSAGAVVVVPEWRVLSPVIVVCVYRFLVSMVI